MESLYMLVPVYVYAAAVAATAVFYAHKYGQKAREGASPQ